MAKRKDRKKNWDQVAWTRFEAIEPPSAEDLPEDWRRFLGDGHAKWMANSIYLVLVRALRSEPPFGDVVHLTIMTHDQQPRHDWRELQAIKNDIVGERVEAVEVFPSEERLVDSVNHYHLFCFPQLATGDGWLPFGFRARAVAEGSVPGVNDTGNGFRQRDFRPELRPDDVIRSWTPGKGMVQFGPDDRVSGRCPADGSAFVFRSGAETHRHVDGKLVRMERGECLKGHHVVYVAPKQELDENSAP